MSALPKRRATRESLHAALLAADSATSVLESFFGAITVQRRDQPPSPNEGLRERLRLTADDVLRHRAVRLVAGDKMLSQAELWYVANRLPAERVQTLATSDTPFGRIMKPLGLKRIVLETQLCAPAEDCSLVHRAILVEPRGLPVAEVYERYAKGLFEDS